MLQRYPASGAHHTRTTSLLHKTILLLLIIIIVESIMFSDPSARLRELNCFYPAVWYALCCSSSLSCLFGVFLIRVFLVFLRSFPSLRNHLKHSPIFSSNLKHVDVSLQLLSPSIEAQQAQTPGKRYTTTTTTARNVQGR